MWDVTGWAAVVWLKWTLALLLGVGAAWLFLPAGSGWLWLVYGAAAWIEYVITRQLSREWLHQAHFTWWWAR